MGKGVESTKKIERKKLLKKVEKSVDKAKQSCYYKQAPERTGSKNAGLDEGEKHFVN